MVLSVLWASYQAFGVVAVTILLIMTPYTTSLYTMVATLFLTPRHLISQTMALSVQLGSHEFFRILAFC